MKLASLRSWLSAVWRRPSMERDLDEELRFHIERYAEDLETQGVAHGEAVRRARAEFGAVAARKDECRDALGLRLVDELRQDLRFALRTMVRDKSFAATALLTVTLGIAMTTIVFSLVNGVLFTPLPYAAANRLVRVWEEHPGGTPITNDRWISNDTFYAWTHSPRTVDLIGAVGTYDTDWEYTVQVGDDTRPMFGSSIAPGLLDALGARPVLGRLLLNGDAQKGNDGVVLLSERLWKDVFGGDAHMLGRSLVIDDVPRVVVGIVDGRFSFPNRRASFWLPYVGAPGTAIARMVPGATVAQVEAEGTAAARSVPVTLRTQLLFGKGGAPIVHARPLAADLTASVRPALLVLAVAVCCLLLTACANVANLLLSRGVARQRELSVRTAIGAGRLRLARQLLTEAAVFSLLGGLAGVGLAWAVIHALPAIAPARFPRLDDVHLDARVMAVAMLAIIVTTIASGLAPAMSGVAVRLNESLRGGDGAIASGFRGAGARHLRDALVASEAAFAVLLLVGAGLLAHSFIKLTHVDAGYTADRVLTARAHLPPSAPAPRTVQFAQSVLSTLRAVPGVRAVGAGSMMPLFAVTQMTQFTLPPPTSGSAPVQMRQITYTVTPGYAEAIGLRLREGRLFDDRDADSGVRRMIVNEEFARRYPTGASLIGRHFANLVPNSPTLDTEIVGVVGTVLKDGNDRRPEPEVYFVRRNADARGFGPLNLVIRTSGNPSTLAATVRNVIRKADRDAIVDAIEPLEQRVATSVAQPRFAMTVLSAFAVAAVLLAAIGLYGVLSYSVSRRRRELGLRAALGSSKRGLIRVVVEEGLSVTLAGLAIGLLASVAFTRFMQSALFGVTPLDPTSFIAAPAILTAVAIVSCLRAAAGAASVDPAEALRRE